MTLASLAENSDFVAFNAHWGFAFFIMTLAQHFHLHMLPVITGCVLAAAFKEFWWDIKYEQTPPQTFKDGLLDFTGYVVGIGLGCLLPWIASISVG